MTLREAVANHLQDNLGNEGLDQPWVSELFGILEAHEVETIPPKFREVLVGGRMRLEPDDAA